MLKKLVLKPKRLVLPDGKTESFKTVEEFMATNLKKIRKRNCLFYYE